MSKQQKTGGAAAVFNEYLLELVSPKMPMLLQFLPVESRAEIQHKTYLEHASDMMMRTTDFIADKGLTDEFQRATAIGVAPADRSWVLISCTEELKDKIQSAFPKEIQKSVCLGPAGAKKGW